MTSQSGSNDNKTSLLEVWIIHDVASDSPHDLGFIAVHLILVAVIL